MPGVHRDEQIRVASRWAELLCDMIAAVQTNLAQLCHGAFISALADMPAINPAGGDIHLGGKTCIFDGLTGHDFRHR